jgi:hypothetical protein
LAVVLKQFGRWVEFRDNAGVELVRNENEDDAGLSRFCAVNHGWL